MNGSSEVEKYITEIFGRLGVNKAREISRLVYEIAKRDDIHFRAVVIGLENMRFGDLKRELLLKRYPHSCTSENSSKIYLPRLDIIPGQRADLSRAEFYPKKIYVENEVKESETFWKFREYFPEAEIEDISSIKEYFKGKHFTTEDFNNRADNVFVVKEEYDFFKSCPCTSMAVPCGYNILNIGFGCPYECAYCFLQGYQNFPGIIVPANEEEFFRKLDFEAFSAGMFGRPRIGSGEFTDSLVFDSITGLSSKILKFFSTRPHLTFEFKTKSVNIENIVNCDPQENIVISWSVNPQNVIKENEFLSPSLEQRIKAASECAKAGFGVGFHFDPIIFYDGWEEEYFEVINLIFDAISGNSIRWISLGTLRMTPSLKKVIENRFPENRILDGELLLGYDNKLRYSDDIRSGIYKKMISQIRKRCEKVIIYLCMEKKHIWENSGLSC